MTVRACAVSDDGLTTGWGFKSNRIDNDALGLGRIEDVLGACVFCGTANVAIGTIVPLIQPLDGTKRCAE